LQAAEKTPQRLKPSQNKRLIAAVNRCATQKLRGPFDKLRVSSEGPLFHNDAHIFEFFRKLFSDAERCIL
jgi:hypothetical protein